MSTLNEIAANYARMAKELEDLKRVSAGDRDVFAVLADLAQASDTLNEQFASMAKGNKAPLVQVQDDLQCA
jgi:hypothetical protein